MEERKLNLNAPLLSVRRISNMAKTLDGAKVKKIENFQLNKRHTLPSRKLDTNLDQVTEPVAVPFHWEQIPGRAKDSSMEESKILPETSVTRKVPPRRLVDVVKHYKGKNEPKVQKEALVEPKVPFRRLLDVAKHHKGKPSPKVPHEASVPPRIPPSRASGVIKHQKEKISDDQSVSRPKIEANSLNEHANKSDCPKEGANEKAGSNSDNDDAYSDALDTLSPTDSVSMNCSASGLSGPDVPVVKPSGTFSMDQQTRDFMMGRFLPAAKAMVLEPVHCVSRKQPAAVEQSRQISKVSQVDRTTPTNKSQCIIIPHYDQDGEEEESEGESGEYNDSGNISAKACGWFPRLCFKNSLCLLNPIPGLKPKAQASMPSTHDLGKQNAAHTRSHSQILKKLSKDAVQKQKPGSGGKSPRMLEAKNKLSCASNRFIFPSDRQIMSRTAPFRCSAGTSPFRHSWCTSPYRNEAPQSPFRGRGFLGMPKEGEDFKASRLNLSKGISKSQELSSHYGAKRGSRPVSPIIEKTFYVDTVRKAEIPFPDSRSPSTKHCVNFATRDFKTRSDSREIKEAVAVESSFQHAKCLNILEGESELAIKVSGSADGDSADTIEDESKALVCVSAPSDGKVNIDVDHVSKADDPVNVKTSLVEYPLPPVLPNTPSESWLWRTLPSISSQNPFSHLYRGSSFQSKWQDPKTLSSDTKWETIVKSSYLHHDHVRYSEELIPYVSQHSKS